LESLQTPCTTEPAEGAVRSTWCE